MWDKFGIYQIDRQIVKEYINRVVAQFITTVLFALFTTIIVISGPITDARRLRITIIVENIDIRRVDML